MGRVKHFLLGGIFFSIIYACGTVKASFPYRYYNLKPDRYEGKLEGAKPQDDLPLETCAPSPGKQNKCTVFLTEAFEKLKADYQKLQIENQDLRKELQNCH